jgi:hypothetical protein
LTQLYCWLVEIQPGDHKLSDDPVRWLRGNLGFPEQSAPQFLSITIKSPPCPVKGSGRAFAGWGILYKAQQAITHHGAA